MNWTGGRLRRHSNNNCRTATLSKVQKQNFAKSRTKAPKDSHHDLPFQGFAQFRQLRKDGLQNDEAGAGSGETIHVSTQQSSRLLSQPSPKPATRLDRLKRQLLDKADWAAVSVSRPLQMRFTPTAELEGFGKRRRLTEADRNRLANCGTKPPVPEVAVVHQSRREASPGIDTIGDMDIRINGAPARKDEDIRLSSSSSQSMLLDRESPCLEHESHRQNDRCANINLGQLSTSVQPSTSLLSALLPSPSPVTELPPFSPIARDTGTLIDNPFSGQRLLPELRETSPAPISCSYVTQSMESPIRRFTIDDQVLAEQEGMLDISSTIPETQHLSRQVTKAADQQCYVRKPNRLLNIPAQVISILLGSHSQHATSDARWIEKPIVRAVLSLQDRVTVRVIFPMLNPSQLQSNLRLLSRFLGNVSFIEGQQYFQGG